MTEEEEDWFARALEDDQERGGSPDEEWDDAFSSPDAADIDTDAADIDTDAADIDTDAASSHEIVDDAAAGDSGADDEDAPFDQDFAAELQSASDPGGGSTPGFGGDDGGFEDGGFDDGGFGGLDDDAGGGGFGFGESEFDEDEFDSDMARIAIGIDGLDEMILGGVPELSLMTVIGGAGTGKTTFGLQFLRQGLEADESGVYITLEETRERVLTTADEKGWDFSTHADEGRLAVVDLDPIEMANSLSSLSSDLPDLVQEFGATRLVLDSVSLLEMMYDHPSTRRSEVFEFARALKGAGVTTLVTSEASGEMDYASRYGIIEYLADAVFFLQYVRSDDFQETRLAVEIQKIRDANHSRETKPYEITDEGISVYRQANIF